MPDEIDLAVRILAGMVSRYSLDDLTAPFIEKLTERALAIARELLKQRKRD